MDGKRKKHSIASIDTFPSDNTSKPESRLSKFGLGKLKRRSSLGKDKRKSGSDQLKNIDLNNAPFSITIQRKETPITPDKDLSNSPSPPPVPTIKPLSKSTSKSEDSLDSGIYSRQKSCDSMDSVGSATSNADQPSHCTSFATGGGLSPSNETQRRVVADNNYDMYWSEVHNIRESISHEDITTETKARPVGIIRTDSGGDDEEDHEADWLREAGLADLVTSSTSPTNSSTKLSGDRSSQVSTDSLSSMTVLSTLTRPQRAAVLRRITSFNRAQVKKQTKRQPKPHIRAVFPDASGGDTIDHMPPKPVVQATTPDGDVTIVSKLSDAEISSKSASLPHGITGLDDVYPRRYSEIPRTSLSRLTNSDENLTTQATSGTTHVMTVGNKSHIKKGDMDSIVAAGNSTGEMDQIEIPSPEATEFFTEEVDYPEVFRSPPSSATTKQYFDSYFDKDSSTQKHFSYPIRKKRSTDEYNWCSLKRSEVVPFVLSTGTTNVKQTKLITVSQMEPTVPSPVRISSFLYNDQSKSTIMKEEDEESTSPEHSLADDTPSPGSKSPAYIAFTSAITPGQISGLTNYQSVSPYKTMKQTFPSPMHSSRRRRSIRDSIMRVTDSLLSSPHRVGSYKLPQVFTSDNNLQRTSSLHLYRRRPSSDTMDLNYLSPRIESLSIRSRSTDDNSRWSGNGNSDLHFSDADKPKVIGYSETANQEKLPTFSLVKDRLGITRISDLSPPDVRKVQSLALIELTALFDLHGIELKRRKFGKTKIKDSGTFGVLLTTLLETDQKRQNNPNIKVAYVLQEIIAYLEDNGLNDEGILRVPGSSVRIKNLKQELEERYTKPIKFLDAESGWGNARTNDVAALLKQFLRELPNPLLTTEYIDAFMACELISERKQQLQALNLLILLLHTMHRDALKLILKFLSRVVAHEESNKMSLNNVAMIMAPNLFMGRKSSKRDMPSAHTASQDVKHAAGTSNIVRMLIKYHKILWTVPTFMLTQVRNMNQAEQSSKKQQGQSKDKGRLKFLPGISRNKETSGKKVSPVASQPFDYEVPKGVIRVQILNHTMTSMAVQVNSQTTAAEVIGKVTRQCEKAREMSPESKITVITEDTHALYEVGGNINERCLDPGTNMHMLTKVNPEATWVIKKRLSH